MRKTSARGSMVLPGEANAARPVDVIVANTVKAKSENNDQEHGILQMEELTWAWLV